MGNLIRRLDISDSDFQSKLSRLLERNEAATESVGLVVSEIISDVRLHGDEALLRYTNKFE